MSRRTSKFADESLACAVLRAALGALVTVNDDGSSQSMYDLRIEYPDGRRAAAEVVSTRDRRTLDFQASVDRGGAFTSSELLTRTWLVEVSTSARVRELRRAAPRLLAQLEANGVGHVSRGVLTHPDLKKLGILSCTSHVTEAGRSHGFYFIQEITAAWNGDPNDGDRVVEQCERFLAATPDVPSKLIGSGHDERHAVVIVTMDWLQSFISIEASQLPTNAPNLPAGVDCLWLIASKEPGPVRSFYWLGDSTWREIVLTGEQLQNGGL